MLEGVGDARASATRVLRVVITRHLQPAHTSLPSASSASTSTASSTSASDLLRNLRWAAGWIWPERRRGGWLEGWGEGVARDGWPQYWFCPRQPTPPPPTPRPTRPTSGGTHSATTPIPTPHSTPDYSLSLSLSPSLSSSLSLSFSLSLSLPSLSLSLSYSFSFEPPSDDSVSPSSELSLDRARLRLRVDYVCTCTSVSSVFQLDAGCKMRARLLGWLSSWNSACGEWRKGSDASDQKGVPCLGTTFILLLQKCIYYSW